MNSKAKKAAMFKEARRRFGVATRRPQDVYPLYMDSRRKLNLAEKFPHLVNPYLSDILAWVPTPDLFQPNHIKSKAGPIFVDSASTFQAMMSDNNCQTKFAVDMENHIIHSYRGMTYIIQVSTTSKN